MSLYRGVSLFSLSKQFHLSNLVSLYFRTIRETWIKAKYVQKLFVAKLPGPKTTTGKKLRGWSVKKKSRRSPSKSTGDQSDNDLYVTSGLMEGR
jgi:hypothetical protein